MQYLPALHQPQLVRMLKQYQRTCGQVTHQVSSLDRIMDIHNYRVYSFLAFHVNEWYVVSTQLWVPLLISSSICWWKFYLVYLEFRREYLSFMSLTLSASTKRKRGNSSTKWTATNISLRFLSSLYDSHQQHISYHQLRYLQAPSWVSAGSLAPLPVSSERKVERPLWMRIGVVGSSAVPGVDLD